MIHLCGEVRQGKDPNDMYGYAKQKGSKNFFYLTIGTEHT